MVRNARAAAYEDIQRSVVAVGNVYPAGHTHPMHEHSRAQLLHAITGTMVVTTDQGAWIVPPRVGLWIPHGVRHGFHMISEVTTRSAYIAPGAALDMPTQCCVMEISSLLRELLIEAVDVPVEYEVGSRAEAVMTLLLFDLRAAPVRTLVVPFPKHEPLAGRCRQFLESPTTDLTIDHWAQELAMSRRAFTRLFRRETGMSLAEWRRQAAVLQAIHRIAAGDAITTIALDLGYGSPAAFTNMFKRLMGRPPSQHVSMSIKKVHRDE